MNNRSSVQWLVPATLLSLRLAGAEANPAVVLENSHFRYSVASDGRNLAFEDKAAGVNHLASPGSPCALARQGGREFPVTSAGLADNQLTLRFEPPGVEAKLRVGTAGNAVLVTVESVAGEDVEGLVFLNAPLDLQGKPNEAFGACALAMNLITRVDQLPVLQTSLRAGCEAKFGLRGARVALVAGPVEGLRSQLQEVLRQSDELPLCEVAGPWADEIPFNHGSYLFNFGALDEDNLDDWIAMVRRLGFTQIDNHGGGGFFRFGDFELNREKWPGGWAAWERIVGRLHDAGIGSIFHTYAFFIDKRSRYVTPVPDPRLDAFRTFTLTADVDAAATEIAVEQSTAGLSTVTGFFEHNSVILQLDDELVTFAGFSREPPWRFTGVRRGALGTKATAHSRGGSARHLKECFGLLVPDPESSLFEEIAANHAEIVNRCGFDGIYLDAIDGSSILRGNDECWYWANKFVVEIQRHLKKPVGMEMSAMWHQFWRYRTRWQAWDYPQRGHRRFIDAHATGVNGGLLLPLHLGWWNFQSFRPPQIEPTYPDVMEYLGARLVGWDAGISLTGAVDRDRLESTPLFRQAVDILRTCEELRHANVFDEEVRSRLRTPGQDFALTTNAAGRLTFCPSQSLPHVAARAEPWTLSWQLTNRHGEQPLCFRLEALMSSSSEPGTNGLVLFDASDAADLRSARSVAEGVGLDLGRVAGTEAEPDWLSLTATNAGRVPRNAAWAKLVRRFDPPISLKEQQALAVEIEVPDTGGDSESTKATTTAGPVPLLAIRLDSPHHLSFGALADRYLPLDFTGRRKVTLVETESTRWSDYTWNDGKWLYNAYRETIDFGTVESAGLWLQNLSPDRELRCRIHAVRAEPMVACRVAHPRLVLNGHAIKLPVELKSGDWLDWVDDGRYAVHGSAGEVLLEGHNDEPPPPLRAGENTMQLVLQDDVAVPPRVRLTVFARGAPLPRSPTP
ncbi:MAG: hypothetical protein H7A46_09635 [Verrucomicrobiales bacterium]|nr:hypothetical protein [Verrucomicrobiales bacterium]